MVFCFLSDVLFFVDTDQREVEEHFIVAITGVSGNASIDSLTSNVTVIILKHGMPNGLFGFESLSTQTVSESRGSPVLLTVRRREGREGTAEVILFWRHLNFEYCDTRTTC